MDCLARYIQQGKLLKSSHLTLLFGIIALVLAVIAYALAHYVIEQPPMQTLVASIPTVIIQNGSVVEPQNTTWRKTIPDTDMGLVIDTTVDELTDKPTRNTVYLTRKKYYIAFENETKVYELPTENVTIDRSVLKATLKNALYRLALMTAGLMFALLWLGYWGVYFLTRVLLWSVKKQQPLDMLCRSALVGWLAVLTLDIILILTRHGFGLNWAIMMATIISVFSVYLSKRDS